MFAAKTLLAVVCLVGAVSAVSIPSVWESSSSSSSDLSRCAPATCHTAEKFAYEVGQTYVYSYDSQTKLAAHGKDQSAGPAVRLAARVEIAVQEPCRMILRLREVTVSGPVDAALYKRQLEASPLAFAFDDGKIDKICPAVDDADWVVNIKRAVLSALQVSPRTWDSQTTQTIREVDVIGTCDTQYEIQKAASAGRGLWTSGSQTDRIVVKKTKSSARCTGRNAIRSALSPRNMNMPLIAATYNCEQIVESRLLKSVSCQDTNEVVTGQHGKVLSHINLQYQRKVASPSQQQDASVQHSGPASLLWNKQQTKKASASFAHGQQIDENTVGQTLRKLVANMEIRVDEQTPDFYEELTSQLEELPYAALFRLYQQAHRGSFGSAQNQEKQEDIFLSAVSDCQSAACVKTLVEVIKQKQISNTRATYYLAKLTFALGVEPEEELVQALIPLVEYEHPVRQAFFALSNLAAQLDDKSHVAQQAADAIAKHVSCKDENEAIAAAKALDNIGYFQGEAKNAVLAVASGRVSQPDSVQAAAIDALSYIADQTDVKQVLFAIFEKQDESAEVRIAAYRTIMEAANQRDVQRIAQYIERSERNTQVGSYVTSHWQNLKSTSHPEKQTVRQWVKATDIKRAFPHDLRKYSENFELSAHPKLLQSGAALEGDLIYTKHSSEIPTFAMFNTSAQFFGKHLQVVEMGFRQENLDAVIEEFFEELTNGAGNLELPSLVKKVMQKLALLKNQDKNQDKNQENQHEEQDQQQYQRHPRSASHQQQQQQQHSSRNQAQKSKDDVNMFWYLKVAGRTVMVLADEDFRADSYQINWDQIFQKLQQGVKLNRAFAAQIVDSHYEIPAVSGMTLALDSNVTFITSLVADIKTDVKELAQILKGGNGQIKFHAVPSFVLQGSYSFGLESPEKKQQILVENTISSSPAFGFSLDVSNRKAFFTVDMPEQEIQILKASSRVYVVDSQGNQKEIQSRNQHKYTECSQWGAQASGLAFCYNAEAPKPVVNQANPLWIGGPFKAELTLQKRDRALRKYQLAIEASPAGASQKFLRAEFNTPGSTIDRQVKGELQLATNPRSGLKEVTYSFRAPQNKQVNGKATLQKTDARVTSQITGNVNGQKKLQIDATIDYEQNRQSGKTEFRPTIRAIVGAQNSEPLVASGRIAIQKQAQRKQSVAITLKAGKADEHQFAANLVQDASRVACDISGQTPVYGQAQAHLTLERAAQRSASISGDVQYKCAHRSCQKQNVRVAAKINNLSAAGMKKFNAHAEVASSASADSQLRADWNLVLKAGEHCENELNMAWGRNQQDKRNQLRLAHIVKMTTTGERDARLTALEMKAEVLVGPKSFDKQCRIVTRVQQGPTPKFHLQFEGQDNQNANKRVEALIDYQLQSSSPLRIATQAHLKSPKYDLSYSDNIQEVQPQEYKGKTIVGYAGRQTTVDYRFAHQVAGAAEQYKMEYLLATPSGMKQKHQTLFKYDARRKQWQLQSSTEKNGDRQLFLDAQAEPGKKVEINAELKRDGKQYKAVTRVQIDSAAEQFSAVSRLTKDTQQVYQVEFTRQGAEAKLDAQVRCPKDQDVYRIFAQAKKSAGANQRGEFTLQCQKNDKNVIRAEAQIAQNNQQAHIEAEYSPLAHRASAYKVQADLEMDSVAIHALKDAKQVAFLKAQYRHQQSGSRASAQQQRQIEVEAEYQPEAQRQPLKHKTTIQVTSGATYGFDMSSMTEKYGKTLYKAQSSLRKDAATSASRTQQWQLNGQLEAKQQRYQTQNKIQIQKASSSQKQQQTLSFDSLTQKNGRQIAQVKVTLRPQAQSVVDIQSPLCVANCAYDAQRKSASIQIHYPSKQIQHKTEAFFKRGELQLQSVTEKDGQQIMQLGADLKQWARSTLKVVGGKQFALNALCDREQGAMKFDVKQRDHQWDMDLAGFGSEQMNLQANKLYKGAKRAEFQGAFSTAGKSMLRMETPYMFLEGQLSPWARQSEAEATIEFRQKNDASRMISHKTELRRQPGQISLKTIHSQRGQQIVSLDTLLSRQGLNVIDMQIPNHSARFEMQPFCGQQSQQSQQQQPRFAQLAYQCTGPQTIEHLSRFELAPQQQFQQQNAIVIQSRHAINGAQWMSVEAHLSKQGDNNIVIIAPQANGQMQWTRASAENKALRLQFEGKQFPLQHLTEIRYDAAREQLKIDSVQCESRQTSSQLQQTVTCPKNKQVYKVQVQADKQGDIDFSAQRHGEQVLKGSAQLQKVSQRNGAQKFDAQIEYTPLNSRAAESYKAVGSFEQDARQQQVIVKVQAQKNGRQVLALQALKDSRNAREQQIQIDAEYQCPSAPRSAQPHKHTTKAVIKSNEIQIQSQTTLAGDRLYQASALIKKIADSRRASQWTVESELTTQSGAQYEAQGDIFWSADQLKMQTDCKKNGQKALVCKATLRLRGESSLEMESYEQSTLLVEYDNVRKVAHVSVQMPVRQVEHDTKINWKRAEVTVESLTQVQQQQLLQLAAHLTQHGKSQLKITSDKQNFNLEAECVPQQGKLSLDAQSDSGKYTVLCEGFGAEHMTIKAYKIDRAGNHHSKVESRINRRGAGESHIDFDLKNYAQGRISADFAREQKYFQAAIQGQKRYGFKHETVFRQQRAGEPMTFTLLHQDKRGRQVVKADGELNGSRAASKITLEIPSHSADLIMDAPVNGEQNVVLSVKSKAGAARQFQHQTAIRGNSQRIQIRQQHSVSGSPALQVNGLFDRRADMPSSLGYERGLTRVQFAVQPRGERKIASAQLKDLIKGYNHSSSVEFSPRAQRFGLTTETSRNGSQVMKMMAAVDQKQSSNFELQSRLASAGLYVDQANNNMAWQWQSAKDSRQ